MMPAMRSICRLFAESSRPIAVSVVLGFRLFSLSPHSLAINPDAQADTAPIERALLNHEGSPESAGCAEDP